MACLIPKTIVNPRYKKIAPDSHFFLYHVTEGKYPKNDYYIQVGCGSCINCFKKYMSSWRFRLLHEFLNLSESVLKNSYYVTLTIENRFYTEKKPLLKKMVRRFLERVRSKYKKSIRHFLVTERGEDFNRLHFHGFFIDPPCPANEFYNLWYYGFVDIQPVLDPKYPLDQKISYCTSYITKGRKGKLPLVLSPEEKPLVLVSPGFGRSYVDTHKGLHHQSTILFSQAFELDGTLRSLPRYLRQYVFSDNELKVLKDDYFDSLSDDVIPDPPYFIGERQYNDYDTYTKALVPIKQLYHKIYGK